MNQFVFANDVTPPQIMHRNYFDDLIYVFRQCTLNPSSICKNASGKPEGAFKNQFYPPFLGATRSIEPIGYGNVSVWVAVCHRRYCVKTTKPILNFFDHLVAPSEKHSGPFTPIPNTKGEPLQRGLYIHGGRKNWRFSTEMADISETVRDRTMVTIER